MIYDEILNFIFKYVFENIIDHINAICYINKCHISRIDIISRYCLNTLSLFSKDMIENIFFLTTFATKDTILKVPEFINGIKVIPEFINITVRLNWFSCDSKTILDNDNDNDNDNLTKYSYNQLFKLYEEKVKKMKPKDLNYLLVIFN